MASRNFTGLLKDLLCCQLKLEGIEKLEHANGKPSRFRGIRLRTEADRNLANLLSSPAKVQQKSSKSPANKKDSPANPAKSKFPNQPRMHVENQQSDSENKNANAADMQEKSNFAGFARFAGLDKQNQQVNENFAGLVPDFCWTGPGKSPANSLEAPPDLGDGYMDSLVESAEPGLKPEPSAQGATFTEEF